MAIMPEKIQFLPKHIQDQINAQMSPPAKKVKKQKYNAIKTQIDGVKYDSKMEAKRHQQLMIKEMAGLIKHLKCHGLILDLGPTDKSRSRYKPDFSYFDCEKGVYVIEEVKGFRVRDWPPRAALIKRVWPEFELRVVDRV